MSRWTLFLGAGVIVVAASAVAVLTVGPWDLLATNVVSPSVVTKPVSGFYLDMGASTSLGFQPTGISGHNGKRTSTGYANDLVSFEAKNDVTLALRQIGCPGETVQRILGQLKDACYTLPNTQLLVAQGFLRANENHIGLVTIDLGFNNIRPCMLVAIFDPSCAKEGIGYVQEYLPTILRKLQAAAGPNVHFVGLEYADPFLADYLIGAQGRANASETLTAFSHLNTVLGAIYHSIGIKVAAVAQAYESSNVAPSRLKGVGVVPTNVAEACSLTWQCTGTPFGPDDHPNNAGYQVIARAIETQLPRKW
jgi:lysophospholipase L1-like esterase